jgi:CBS domain-containing protein
MLDCTGNHKFTSNGAYAAATLRGESSMNVRDGMSKVVLSVGPAHTLREAARLMSAQRVGAAVVTDAEHSGIGILTERDVLDSIGAGQDPDAELVADHRTADVVFASPEWTLQQAATTMTAGGFRHLVVVEAGEVAGLLSMRDIVRCWSGSSSPADAAAGGAAGGTAGGGRAAAPA